MTVGKPWARTYVLTVLAGWILLIGAGVYMAGSKGIPAALAVPVVAAFLLEYVFYMVAGFEGLRNWSSDRVPVRSLAFSIALSGIAPYLLYSLATGQFRQVAAVRLTVLVFVLSYWYVFRRPSRISDLAFLALVAAALVTRGFFRQIYVTPVPSIPNLEILGRLMLARLVPTVMLTIREVDGTGFGFVPTAREWKIGLKYFLIFLPIGIGLSAALKLFSFKTSATELAIAPFLFLLFFWTTALPEEFLARGLLQQWISNWSGRQNVGLILASCVFGLSHLWFSPGYPNWKMAITATVAGFFYGKAYIEAGGVRASAIAHALVVTAWRTLS